MGDYFLGTVRAYATRFYPAFSLSFRTVILFIFTHMLFIILPYLGVDGLNQSEIHCSLYWANVFVNIMPNCIKYFTNIFSYRRVTCMYIYILSWVGTESASSPYLGRVQTDIIVIKNNNKPTCHIGPQT